MGNEILLGFLKGMASGIDKGLRGRVEAQKVASLEALKLAQMESTDAYRKAQLASSEASRELSKAQFEETKAEHGRVAERHKDTLEVTKKGQGIREKEAFGTEEAPAGTNYVKVPKATLQTGIDFGQRPQKGVFQSSADHSKKVDTWAETLTPTVVENIKKYVPGVSDPDANQAALTYTTKLKEFYKLEDKTGYKFPNEIPVPISMKKVRKGKLTTTVPIGETKTPKTPKKQKYKVGDIVNYEGKKFKITGFKENGNPLAEPVE